MAVYTYTGKLTDFGEAPFPSAIPRLFVQPKRDAFSPSGPSAARRIPVSVASDGKFSVRLIASADMVPPTAYSLRCEWLATPDGEPFGWAQWDFTAYQGGGPISDGGAPPTFSIWIGPPWPPRGTPGLYIDKDNENDWGVR